MKDYEVEVTETSTTIYKKTFQGTSLEDAEGEAIVAYGRDGNSSWLELGSNDDVTEVNTTPVKKKIKQCEEEEDRYRGLD